MYIQYYGTGDGISAAALLHDHHGGAVLQQPHQLYRPQGARPTGRYYSKKDSNVLKTEQNFFSSGSNPDNGHLKKILKNLRTEDTFLFNVFHLFY